MSICRLIGQLLSWSCLLTQAYLASDRLDIRVECEGCRKALRLRSVIALTLVALALCISVRAIEAEVQKR